LTPKNRSINKCNRSNRQVNPLRLAWVNLLNRYNWDWFATLTFKDLPKTYTAHNRVNRWLNTLEKQEKRKIGYYKGMEFTKQGVPHFHLLMGNLEGVRRDKYWGLWFTQNGRARILPYEPNLGAGYYLTKYIVKDEYSCTEQWEIIGLEYVNQLYLRFV